MSSWQPKATSKDIKDKKIKKKIIYAENKEGGD